MREFKGNIYYFLSYFLSILGYEYSDGFILALIRGKMSNELFLEMSFVCFFLIFSSYIEFLLFLFDVSFLLRLLLRLTTLFLRLS